MFYPADRLSEVFRNTGGHLESSEIIMAHSTNKEDIREFAFRNVNINHAVKVVDLGCGFGFFTQALKGKISPEAVVTGIDCFLEYREPYFTLCRETGFKGQFYDSGIKALLNFNPASVDLVLSSFSMYFFPEVIPRVATLLSKNGIFIVITHYSTHLRELTNLISEMLNKLGFPQKEPLPHDKLIRNFPAEDGLNRLSGYFEKIEKRDYPNELIFARGSIVELLKYVNYKKSFFLPDSFLKNPIISGKAETYLLDQVGKMKEFRITKNDAVFICTHPKQINR
jgi:SAM-dependent methyltransferase